MKLLSLISMCIFAALSFLPTPLLAQKHSGCLKQCDSIISYEKKNADFVFAMLEEVAATMSTEGLETYFSPDFVLFNNRHHLRYGQFKSHLQTVFDSLQSISFKKPFPDLFGKGDRVVARFKCITVDLNNQSREFDSIAIFQMKDQKIYRLWELTCPEF